MLTEFLVLDVQSCILPLMGVLSAQDLQMSGCFSLVASRAENFGLSIAGTALVFQHKDSGDCYRSLRYVFW